METKQKRLNYVDMMKGIAILEIICYHLIAPCAFKSFINLLLGPLLISFFFFSGFFYKPGNRSFGENVKIRAKALLVPFFKYSLFFWVCGTVQLMVTNQETLKEALCCLRNFYIGAIWNRVIQNWFGWEYYRLGSRYMYLADFWYLLSLFFACILFFPIADRVLSSNKKTGIAVVLLLCATGVMRYFKVDLPHNLQIVPFWSAFLLMGAFAGQRKLFEHPSLTGVKGWAFAVVSLAAGLAMSYKVGPVLNLYRGYFPENEVVSMILCTVFSLLIIWGLGLICRLTEETGVRVTELSWLGSHSLLIYLYHVFFAWILSLIFGFSLRYADPSPADVIWKSVGVTVISLILCILRYVIEDRIKAAKASR